MPSTINQPTLPSNQPTLPPTPQKNTSRQSTPHPCHICTSLGEPLNRHSWQFHGNCQAIGWQSCKQLLVFNGHKNAISEQNGQSNKQLMAINANDIFIDNNLMEIQPLIQKNCHCWQQIADFASGPARSPGVRLSNWCPIDNHAEAIPAIGPELLHAAPYIQQSRREAFDIDSAYQLCTILIY